MTAQVDSARPRPRLHFSLLAAAVAAATAGPQLASAQQQPAEEVVVTGSRVARSGFDTPQPVTAINAEQIENLGLVNVGDIARTMPQNTPFFTETNVGVGNFNVGAQLANLRGLNPFFGTRTLTLVDTRRVVPNSEGSAVDLTLIPSILVERMEVVTGGASAAYGSDAIAGVVNVILDKDLEGFRAQVDYGQTSESDGDDMHAALGFGMPFGDGDRGHLLIGAELQEQDAIGPCAITRDWCQDAWAIHTNNAFATGNGLPQYVVAPDSKLPPTETGLFTPMGGVQQQFTPDGRGLMPFDPGQFSGFFTRLGGDGSLSSYSLSNIRPEIERQALMAHVSYELSDSLEFFAEVNRSSSDSVSDPANGSLGPVEALIAPDNAFLSPEILAAAPAGGILSRNYMPNLFSARNTTENDTLRLVAGLNGDLGSNWTWDAYYQYGENENHQRLFHNMVGSFLYFVPTTYNFLGWALDAVVDPADPGNIVCRATIAGDPAFNPLAAGCVPLDLFGTDLPDPAAIDYVYRTLKEDTEYEQNVLGANFRGNLAEGWAGPILGAFGIEWRQDEYLATHDRANQPWYDDYLLDWGLDRGGKIEVTEVYGEVQVPMTQRFQTDFAVRSTRNEATSATQPGVGASRSFESWKVAGIYDPLGWLRFRATRSQDIRAGNFRELFTPRNETQAAPGGFPGPIINRWTGLEEGYLSITGGNPDLKPEQADTTTFGAVFSFDRFRFSVDWFEIDMSDAITPGGAGGVNAQALVDACFAGGTRACGFVQGWGTDDITSVEAGSINIGQFLTRGFDVEALYDFPLENGANLNLRVIGSYLSDLIVDTGLGNEPVNYEGQSGPVGSFGGFNTSPNWQATAWLTYARDRFTTTLETRYVGSGSLSAERFASPPGHPSNTLPFSMTTNSVDDRYYLAWSGSYDFRPADSGNRLQLFWTIQNLLDEDPPVAPGGNVYPTNPVFFDTLGRRYRVGLRVGF